MNSPLAYAARGGTFAKYADNGGPTSHFALRLLGLPCLSDQAGAGPPVRLGAKELSLLAYLALEPGPHTRDELATLLWGESSDTDARASLRQALKHLRAALGPDLVTERGQVSLAADAVECDVADFRRAATLDRAAASRADIAHALTGFAVRHAPAFDDWLDRTRAQLLREYLDVLATLGRDAMVRHVWREAIEIADRWLMADPLSEHAARLAIEATYLDGNRRAALARFGEFRTRLERETGDAPGRLLTSLVRRIESDGDVPRSTPLAAASGWYANPPPLHAALVEREAAWETLAAAWGSIADDAGAIVLLDGEAGTGKTRLGDEFLRWLVADGATVLRGRGYGRRTGVAYGAVVELLRDAVEEPGIAGAEPEALAEVARLVPELRQRLPGLPAAPAAPDPVQGSRLFESIAQMLLALSAERRVVVALDDLQWCDDDSCNLLLFLTRRLERAPILWLGMVTLGELERGAPVARLCRVWRTQPRTSSLTLAPFGIDGVWALVAELGHLEDSAEGRQFAGRLYDVTGGNPFYLHELLKTLFAQDVIGQVPETGAWVLPPADAAGAGALEVPMSRSVHDAISERVERLPDDAHDVLVTVAVAEIGCRTQMLSHIHGISRLHAASLGDALVERRLLVEEEDAYLCAHPVIARVVRDGLSASRRREVHRAVALGLQLLTGDTGDHPFAADIARHAEHGGDHALAYRAALAASRIARERLTREAALGWLDQAATYARSDAETREVERLTAQLIDAPG